MIKKPKKYTFEEALDRMQFLCSKAEHCEYEIREKLFKLKIDSADIEKIIEILKQQRYVDNRRYVSAFVNDKIKFDRWGPRKVAQALFLKKIDAETIREVLEEIPDPLIEENLKHLISARCRDVSELTREGKLKLLRFAINRGYDYAMSVKVIKEIAGNV